MLPRKHYEFQDCGDGSVQVLAAQARIPEFRFPAPMYMLDMVLTPVIPISWRWRQVISPWGLLLASLAKVVNSGFSGRLSKN